MKKIQMTTKKIIGPINSRLQYHGSVRFNRNFTFQPLGVYDPDILA
jgi:hypothetical protein